MRRALSLLIAACYVSGCGFSPVYGKHSGDSHAVSQSLAGVSIDPIDGRAGQILRANLEDSLNPGGNPDNRNYRLNAVLRYSNVPVSIATDGTVARFNVHFVSQYVLYDKHDTAITSGTINYTTSFNNLANSYYSTYIAEQDAIKRGAQASQAGANNHHIVLFNGHVLNFFVWLVGRLVWGPFFNFLLHRACFVASLQKVGGNVMRCYGIAAGAVAAVHRMPAVMAHNQKAPAVQGLYRMIWQRLVLRLKRRAAAEEGVQKFANTAHAQGDTGVTVLRGGKHPPQQGDAEAAKNHQRKKLVVAPGGGGKSCAGDETGERDGKIKFHDRDSGWRLV